MAGGSVFFDVTDASPRMGRATNLPAWDAATFGFDLRIDTYEQWGEPFIFAGASDYFGFEYDNSNLYVQVSHGGYTSANLWTDGYKGWGRFIVTSDGANVIAYVLRMQPGASVTTGTLALTSTITPTVMEWGGANIFSTDSEGKFYLGRAFAYARALSQHEVYAELFSKRRAPLSESGLTFYNPCNNALDCHLDRTKSPAQGLGGRLTLTGAAVTSLLDTGAILQRPLLEEDVASAGAVSGDGSSSPTITVDATSAALKQADGSSSPAITGTATGASLAAAAASSAPTITVDATAKELAAGAGSSAPDVTVEATSAALKQAAGDSSPTLTVDAASAALKQATALSAPSITADAGGASLAQADASSAPAITVDATGQASSGGSDAASSPSVSAAATGASLFAGAGSSAPSLTIDAVTAALKAVAASCAPALIFDATGASLFAGAGSCAPAITVNATSQITSDAASAPLITVGATGASLAATAGDSSPTLTFNATSAALKQAAASCTPLIIVNATSGGASSNSLWRPDYGSQFWHPDYYPAWR